MAPYLTVAELRAAHPILASTDKYPSLLLEGLVAEFERKLERFRGVAYTTRTRTDRVPVVYGARRIVLSWPLVQAVAGITVVRQNGESAAYTDGFTLDGELGAITTHRALMPFTNEAVAVVTYTHGFAVTPPEVRRACGLYVWREASAAQNPNSRNSYLATNAELGVVERESTADWAGNRPTGWLDVDRIIIGFDDFRADL